MEILKPLTTSSWQESFSQAKQTEFTTAIEDGQILYFPELPFSLSESELKILSPEYVNSKSKNISFDLMTDEIRGLAPEVSAQKAELIRAMLERFAKQSHHLINALFPRYTQALIIGRTSFRPVEIEGRTSSYRKDDKRLHVDAFPANPNHGLRILRVFSNINPDAKARVWRVGEPFEKVAKQFLPHLRRPFPGIAKLLHFLGITKRRRKLYDHYMLRLHDRMKADTSYQRNAQQQEIHFPTNTTWIVQTDHVSHAAMSGQYLLEQTFYLPVHAMLDESKSPLRVLEKLLNKKLI